VGENGGEVRVFVNILSGELERAVQVFISTRDGTATSTAPTDYIGISMAPLQYDAFQRSRVIVIPIINDNILENDEFFFGILNTSDGAVILSVPRTDITILEDPGEDSKTLHKPLKDTLATPGTL